MIHRAPLMACALGAGPAPPGNASPHSVPCAVSCVKTRARARPTLFVATRLLPALLVNGASGQRVVWLVVRAAVEAVHAR